MPEVAEHVVDGHPVRIVTLANAHGRAVLADLGARLIELHLPGRDGALADVVLAPPGLDGLVGDRSYFGATVGRYAGRIAHAAFTLDGVTHRLAANEGEHHVHGGVRGFDQHRWSTELGGDGETVTFRHRSAAGEEGFPGTVEAWVTYRLDANTLTITMGATTDEATVVRMVHHSYWNLAGHDAGDVLGHELRVAAGQHVPLGADLLPSGGPRPVAGTPYDFRAPRPIGAGNAVARDGRGYDDVWALDGTGLRVAASLTDPASGRRLELTTDQAGLCVYAGGHLRGVRGGRAGAERLPRRRQPPRLPLARPAAGRGLPQRDAADVHGDLTGGQRLNRSPVPVSKTCTCAGSVVTCTVSPLRCSRRASTRITMFSGVPATSLVP